MLRPNGQDFDKPLTKRSTAPFVMGGVGITNEPVAQPPEKRGQPFDLIEQQARLAEESRRVPDEDSWMRSMRGQGFTVFRLQGQAVEATPFKADRITGPVQFFANLVRAWDLSTSDAAALLGYEQSDEPLVEALLSGRSSVRGVDMKSRIATLYRIESLASELFRDGELEWMRTPREEFGGRSPIDYLREGSMEHLLTLRQYIEHVSGL